jgi:hypothetical protein
LSKTLNIQRRPWKYDERIDVVKTMVNLPEIEGYEWEMYHGDPLIRSKTNQFKFAWITAPGVHPFWRTRYDNDTDASVRIDEGGFATAQEAVDWCVCQIYLGM